VTFAQLMSMEVQEFEFLGGIFAKGAVNLVAGRPDQGKSLAIHDFAIAHASGKPWLGKFDVGQGAVAYFDFEMPTQGFALRTKAQGNHRGIVGMDIPLYRFESMNHHFDSDEGLREALALVYEYGLSVMIFDPLSDVLGSANENEASPVRQVFARFIELSRLTGVTVILIDHRRKQGLIKSSPLEEIRGSSVKIAKSDTILAVSKSGEETKVEQLRNRWGQKHAAFSFRVEAFEPDVVPVYLGEVQDGGAEMLERCLGTVMETLVDGRMKRQDLIAKVQEVTGAGARTIIDAIKQLFEAQEVTKSKEGRTVFYNLPDEQLFESEE
jgi:hypothetical protein